MAIFPKKTLDFGPKMRFLECILRDPPKWKIQPHFRPVCAPPLPPVFMLVLLDTERAGKDTCSNSVLAK